MQITFLGTGSAIPLPRHQSRFEPSSTLHDCLQCRSQDPRDRRWPTAFLIDRKILIDTPPPIINLLASLNLAPKDISTVLLTHRHADAAGGLSAFGKGTHLVFPKESGLFRVGRHRFKVIKVPHDSQTWGYLIDGSLAYFSDYADIRPALPALKKAKVAVLDGSGWHQAFPTHQPMAKVIPIVKKFSNLKAIYFTHVGHTGLPHFELERKTKELGDDRFHIAYHGLRLEV